MRKLLFSLLLFLAVVGGLGYIWETSAQEADQLTADAGPDQTVAGPSPVMVHFLGKANTEEFNCVWFNQWDRIRANGCDVTFAVNFGNKEAKPGTTRSFLLDVSRPDGTGGSAYDWVTITLGDSTAVPPSTPTPTPTPEPPAGDPRLGTSFSGVSTSYRNADNTAWQSIEAGFLNDAQWYVYVVGSASVNCRLGQSWAEANKNGCVGDISVISDKRLVGVTPIILDGQVASWQVWAGDQVLADITPTDGITYLFEGSYAAVNQTW